MFVFAILYLFIPSIILMVSFCNGFFAGTSLIAAAILVFCIYNTTISLRNEPTQTNLYIKCWPLLLSALVVASLCLMFAFNVWDWEKHYAIFNLLIKEDWPPVIKLDEHTWFLRYYLGWYVMPALFVKIFGLPLLPVLTVWTAVGLFIALFLAFHSLQRTSHFFIAALVFFFFSGLDIVGALLNNYVPPSFPHWPQIWAGWGEIWPALTGIAWVPQHVICGWIGACLFLFNRRLAVRYSAVIVVVIALWSPFCAVGLLPIAAWVMYKEGIKTSFTLQNLLVAPVFAIPIALYLTQSTAQMPFTFAWQHHAFSLRSLALFIIAEFLLIISIFYNLRPKDRTLIVVLGLFLTSLCFVRFGVLNDLLMRGSIPAICILSVWMSKSLLQSKNWSKELLIIYMVVASLPVGYAFINGIARPRVDKDMTFTKLTRIYPYEKYPEMTYSYLVKIENAQHVFSVPLLRNIYKLEATKKSFKDAID